MANQELTVEQAKQEFNKFNDSFNKIVAELKSDIVEEKCSHLVKLTKVEINEKRNLIMLSIQEIILDIFRSLSVNDKPQILIRNNRSWNDCNFNKILKLKKDFNESTLKIKFVPQNLNKDFAQILFVLIKIYELLNRLSSSSRREIYYENLDLFDKQNQLDSVADKVSCLLGVPQWEIGLLSCSKGVVSGSLCITSHSTYIDCSVQGGALVPNDLVDGIKLTSDAKFVLVVEKDSAFQKLYDEGFLQHHGPCIMVTGKGYPDVCTRFLVKSIWEQLSLPIFILADSDPYGIEIMCIYKFGSLKQAHIGDQLAVPSAKWLGVHPTDIDELNLKSKLFSEMDIMKTHHLLLRPYINENKLLENQLKVLSESHRKSEIEGLIEISAGYLTDVYIPSKIISKQYI